MRHPSSDILVLILETMKEKQKLASIENYRLISLKQSFIFGNLNNIYSYVVFIQTTLLLVKF